MITVEELRQLALSLPGVEERDFWGEPIFRVPPDIFLTLSPSTKVAGIKLPLDERESLIAMNSVAFGFGRYSGRFGLVTVQIALVDSALMRGLVTQAWQRIAPTHLVAKMGFQRNLR